MCLTLRNAVATLDHQDGRAPDPAYTRTHHHIGYLEPGDYWFPGSDPLPHTVTGVHRRHGHIVLTDQYGSSYSYLGDAVVSTAVPDPRIRTTAAAAMRRNESAIAETRPPRGPVSESGVIGSTPADHRGQSKEFVT